VPAEKIAGGAVCNDYVAQMAVMGCATCGGPIFGRADKRYCSDFCRLHAFRQRSRGDRTVLGELADVLGDALAEPVLLALVARAARADWRAAAWILEHRWPQQWGPPALRASVARDPLDDFGLDDDAT
jgi:hypothetical protein